jgi:3-hydroxyisobutyrate dehydrogenase-like beta-hydroxyacid dehydrogenase
MKIGVLGTGPVGQAIAAKLGEVGHGVFVGTRDPAATLARQAAAHGEVVVNCTQRAVVR